MFIATNTLSKTAFVRSELLAPDEGKILSRLGAINIWLLMEPGSLA